MTISSSVPKLFSPIRVGDAALAHRVVMAPLTRYRASLAHVHGNLALKYYSQRGTVSGGLIITEATFIAQKAGGHRNVPGIWSDDQVAAWRRITDAVHEEDDNKFTPRALTTDEVKEYVQLYAKAAANAVYRAGFDGVEIHGANGYLIDQFTQSTSNMRTDEYGGSVENRCRFALEIAHAVIKEVGPEKTGMRLSPWGQTSGMGMPDPKPTFSYLVQELVKRHPTMAYIHVIEPRVHGSSDRDIKDGESNDFLRKIWLSNSLQRVYISAGGFTRDTAIEATERPDAGQELVAFGRKFIANPDLPYRLLKDLPLNEGERDTYYKNESPDGYIDYPCYGEVAN